MRSVFTILLISVLGFSVVEAQIKVDADFLSVKRKSLGRTKYFVNSTRVQRREFENILMTDSMAREELSDAKSLRLVSLGTSIGFPILVFFLGVSEFPTEAYWASISFVTITSFISERKYHKSVQIYNANSLGVELAEDF